MKILERYVLLSFLRNYLISFMVLIGLYIVLDMVLRFDEIVELHERASALEATTTGVVVSILDYYFWQSFAIFAQLSGVIPVVAAAFTLVRMSRFNEMTAILAAGVPLLRIAAPIILAAVGLNVLLIVDQELIVPRIIPKLTRSHDELYKSAGVSYPVRAMQEGENRLLFAGRYYPLGPDGIPRMRVVDILEVDEQFRPVWHLRADQADWNARHQRWDLTNGQRVRGLAADQRRSRPEKVAHYQGAITPDEIALYHSGEFTQWLSTRRINELLERPQSYGTADLLRVKHSRFTQWILNVVLLLLAIPPVLTRQPIDFRLAGAKLLGLVGACMASIFLCQQLAGQPPAGLTWADLWPALMAWLPLLIFGPLAVLLLDRLKT